jgi:hypothetical protein
MNVTGKRKALCERLIKDFGLCKMYISCNNDATDNSMLRMQSRLAKTA